MRKAFYDASRILNNKESTIPYRQRMLSEIITFAKKNTIFYAKVKGASLYEFPVIDKKVLLDNYSDFIVPSEKIPNQVGKIHIQKTSGSTGTPFEIRQDTRCRTRRIALIKAANELIGFHSFVPMMHLRSVKHYWNDARDITWRKDLQILYVDNANLTDAKISKIVSAIDEYGIRFIRGYMTTLDTITRYMVSSGRKPKKKLTFISVGELLLEPLRKRVVDDLGCFIISQYGNEENGVFGQSEENGTGGEIDLYTANCFIELLKLDSNEPVGDGELGRIVVTDYTNYAMPMIRYDIGDLAIVKERLSSGEIVKLKNLAGRKTDLIYRTDGSALDLFNSISAEIYNDPRIKQWQFIQTGRTDYTLVLNTADSSLYEEAPHFSGLMRDVLGEDANVAVKFVDGIPVLASGKRKVVINQYNK